MGRIANLLASTDAVPTSTDPAWDNYSISEQRLLHKSEGDKDKLLQLYRRVARRKGGSGGRLGALIVLAGSSVVTAIKQATESDLLRSNGSYGQGVSLLGNEMFIGEPGAVGSIFAVGEVHYYTRPDASSDFTRQSGFHSPTQTNGGEFGTSIDYDGSRVIVGEPNVAKRANIFTLAGGVATSEVEIVANTYSDSASRFSRGVALVGDHCLIGAPGQDITQTDQGGVEYWERVAGTWTFRQAFTMNATPVSIALFGSGVTMVDSSTAYIGWTTSGDVTIEKWSRSGTTWTYVSSFTVSGYSITSFVSLDSDGTNLILGAESYDDGGDADVGLAVVLSQAGVVLEEIFGDTVGNKLGGGVSIDGSEAVIGEPGDDPSATNNAGTAGVWDVSI